MSKARRRRAKDWARLVGEWERSGQAAGEFAAARGLRPRTLVWWRWRLRRGRKASNAARRGSVQLVRVQVQDDRAAEASTGDGELAWEVVAPTGHVLRVYGREAELVREALAALMGVGRRS
ncbi:MAG: hypothetical protein JXR33_09145 [Coriobacteriia bacterium]|nr:hypothetical protein [Coriobacteriia bacterium]